MNTEDDSIISRLPLSASDAKRLTVTQIRNVDKMLSQPPPALLNAARKICHEDLIEEFRLFRIPVHATEFPYAQLLRFLKDFIPQWRMTLEEQHLLCAAISRNAASQIVSIPVFVALWRAIADLRPASDATLQEKAIESSKRIIELQYPDTHFIYGLIHQRLGHDLQSKCDHGALLFMRWEDLKREMVTVQIKLSEGSFRDFQASLLSSGIYQAPPENKLNVPLLLAVSSGYVDHVASLTEEVNDRHECSVSSTAARMLRQICPKWAAMRVALEQQQYSRLRLGHGGRPIDGGAGIAEDEFSSVLRRVGGVIATAEDAAHFWEYLVQATASSSVNHTHLARPRARETSLSLKELEQCLGPVAQTYGGMSSLMREQSVYSHKANTARWTYDHMGEIFSPAEHDPKQQDQDQDLGPSPLAHFPWQQVDEAHASSNLKLRAVGGLQHCRPEVLQRFVDRLCREETSCNSSVGRSELHEAMAEAGVHFLPHDMHALWQEIQASVHSLRASDLLRWLLLEHINPSSSPPSSSVAQRPSTYLSAGKLDPAKHNGSLDPVNTALNPRHSQSQSTWDGPPQHQYHESSSRHASLADFAHSQHSHNPTSNGTAAAGGAGAGGGVGARAEYFEEEPDAISSPIDDLAGGASADATYKAALASLLRLRPQLAHTFRRISNGSGLGRGEDLSAALQHAPFSLGLGQERTWALVCRMAGGVDPRTLPARVFLRFNDVATFLEKEAKEHLQPHLDPRMVSIQHKLAACCNVRGSRHEMLEQAHILRTRLRHIRQRGSVTSWDAVPDICYPQEFCQLMESIGLCLTQDEVIYVYRCVNKEEDPANTPSFFNQCRYGMPLGASVTFMSSLCSQ